MKKRLFSILLLLAMVITMMPAMASLSFAGEANPTVPVELVKATTSGSGAVKLSWNKVSGATKYVVYGQRCDKEYKKLITTSKTSYEVKKIKKTKLKAHKTYKFYVVAYKGSKKLATSKSIHFINGKTSGKYANAKSITVKPTSVTLEPGKTVTLKATTKIYKNKKHIKKSHGAATRYVSNCPAVAKVSSSGKVTAVAPGTATIYVQDIGGLWCKTVVTVKKSEPPAPEKKKISEILPNGFPDDEAFAWVNADGKKAYKDGENIKVGNLTIGTGVTVTKSGDNYVCKFGDATVTFNVKDGAVKSITVTGSSDSDGEYKAPETKKISEILPSGFPETADFAWVNADGKKAYKDGENIKVGNLTLGKDTTVTKSGDNYVCKSGDAIVKFNVKDGAVKSITVTGSSDSNGEYKAPETKKLSEILPSGFPETADFAWVNADGKKAYKDGDNIKVGNLTLGKDTTVTKSGDNYVCKSGDATVTFTVKDGAVDSITVTGSSDSDGTYAAPKSSLPEGALKGEFSVSATKKVRFSQGNLVATIDASGAPTAWKFSASQYDCLGEGGANKTIGAAAGDVDFFGWSTSTNDGTSTTDNYGIKTSKTGSDYSGDFYDWGKAVGDGSTWCTLSKDEWVYLINKSGDENIRKGKYKYGVTVCEKTNCLILAPDDFEGTIAASYDATDWASAEAAGLVCLPIAGARVGSDVFTVGASGFYWSSSDCDSDLANCMYFNMSSVIPDNSGSRSTGYSVRLVTEVK